MSAAEIDQRIRDFAAGPAFMKTASARVQREQELIAGAHPDVQRVSKANPRAAARMARADQGD